MPTPEDAARMAELDEEHDAERAAAGDAMGAWWQEVDEYAKHLAEWSVPPIIMLLDTHMTAGWLGVPHRDVLAELSSRGWEQDGWEHGRERWVRR